MSLKEKDDTGDIVRFIMLHTRAYHILALIVCLSFEKIVHLSVTNGSRYNFRVKARVVQSVLQDSYTTFVYYKLYETGYTGYFYFCAIFLYTIPPIISRLQNKLSPLLLQTGSICHIN